MAGTKGKSGAKLKSLLERKHTVVMLLEGSIVQRFGDKLKPDMKQGDYLKTKAGIIKLLNEIPIP